tara:strand:+ start:97481 stop:97966 length:486 start_codon:yes stop_codon:yes gene_type:complete
MSLTDENKPGEVEEADSKGYSNETKDVTLAGNVKDYKAQMKTAAILEEALVMLRSSARTNDYFVGYSLTEVMEERIRVIGGKTGLNGSADDDKVVDQFIPGSTQNPKARTKIARVNYLWHLLLGEDEGKTKEKGGAIGMAINMKEVKDLTWPDGEDEGTGI